MIRIIGAIDDTAFQAFAEQVSEAVEAWRLNVSYGTIRVDLCSEGGDDMAALAFVALMRTCPIKFNVTVYGHAESAATLILACADYRKMTKEAWVMIHESSDSNKGTASEREKAVLHARRMENQWTSILASKTSISKEKWDEMHRGGDRYMTPEECLAIGLIDEII